MTEGFIKNAPDRWSKEMANEWYSKQSWPCGFNYIPANAISYTEIQGGYDLTKKIKSLKSHGRPIINTEWLNRINGSVVHTCLPVFRSENVGCLHWGLVNGKTQTHLGWGWQPGKPEPKEWQHDLYHGDHTPYNEEELTLFRKHIGDKWDSL